MCFNSSPRFACKWIYEVKQGFYPKTIYHVVEPNQTFWEVCTMYSGFDKKYQTLSEFVYETRKINGGKIIYMPGEKIKIIVWQMKEGKIDYGTNSKY